MATKETTLTRIQNTEAQIQKKEALIQKMQDRITKNTDKLVKLGYTAQQIAEGIDNPFRMDRSNPNFDKAFDLCYSISNAQDSIKNAEEALPELREKLSKYQGELQVILEKEGSRNVKPILQFLEMWKGMVKNFYEDCLPKWVEARNAYFKADHEYCEEHNWGEWRRTGDRTKLDELCDIRKKAKERFQKWDFLNPYIIRHKDVSIDWEKVQKDLDHEAEMKYDFIIERTNAIVGQITDASHLDISEKGDLNGVIYGTKGTATVQTIGAGGWNIQCYHFRTLIHAWKK